MISSVDSPVVARPRIARTMLAPRPGVCLVFMICTVLLQPPGFSAYSLRRLEAGGAAGRMPALR
jgi:hypothetical protein